MKPNWFRPRSYKHFDAPVSADFANACDSKLVEKHAWSPLIHYTKRVKRYKPKTHLTVYKPRPIMYASHRDACILSKYSADLTSRLDAYYQTHGLTENVIAYRRLGRANYHFSADAYRFAKANAPCVILCFDITGFFDNLDHRILKERLKRILKVKELPGDWYKVFRHVTRFRKIDREALAAHPKFGPRLALRTPEPIATIAKAIEAGIPITANDKPIGIPQGTPISSALSNLYMIDFDREMVETCRKCLAVYQRYSDDILLICRPHDEATLLATIKKLVKEHRLEIQDEKTDRIVFDSSDSTTIRYLGFNLSPGSAVIRPGSLARQWRKLKRNIRRTKEIGSKAVAEGKASKIFTQKLRRRFSPIGVRNFSSYAHRSAHAFESSKIAKQIRRLERAADDAIRNIEK